MFFNVYRLLLCLLAFSIASALPIGERAELSSRSPAPAPLNNHIPDNPTKKACKKVSDCSCPKHPNAKEIHSTSCINGFCQCDNPVVGLMAGSFIKAVAAIGNAPITKAIGQLMQGLADVKEVIGTIVGAMLPPPAKAALKAALNAFPDVGPSHIDQATKAALTKVLK
ncbi:hypothetical protein LshimejAT787_0201290 [Lyophyllum shimeji]|uniref:Uncharacterized protein n=1 Tax=Lyophyllum shimeji TaxID=47721 RepID=A0A9P3PFH7_LYOSH|nr:hypothetical protein LshimejAT787_0201290 [Lyophyllum shimeji]